MTLQSWPLRPYLPTAANPYCFQLWNKYRFRLKISRPRKTKLGDYRFSASQNSHLITINDDLNPYAFLVVYLHEVAHCISTIKYGLGTKPHGSEWQQEMVSLLAPMLRLGVFPEDLERALSSYMKAPKATSCAHPALTKALRKYDPPNSLITLEQLTDGCEFVFQSRRYRRIKVRRTRVNCLELNSRRIYLIPKLAMVSPY